MRTFSKPSWDITVSGGKNLMVFVIWLCKWRSLAVKLNQNKERGGRLAEYSVEKVCDFPVPSQDVTIHGGNMELSDVCSPWLPSLLSTCVVF